MDTFLMPSARQRGWTNAGAPAANCKLYTYDAGTSTPKDTYQDAAGLIPHENPITLDAKGEALIYWRGNYKVDLRTPEGSQITGYPVDNFQTPLMLSDLAGIDAGGLIGFDYAEEYTVGSIGRWLKDLVLSAGASFIGFIQAGAGAVARTVQAKLRDTVHVSDFGALGGTDDAATWQKAIDSGAKTIDARGVVSNILSTVHIGSNVTILFNGAVINTGGTTLKTFSAAGQTKFNLIGPAFINGDLVSNPGTGVTSAAIYIEDCSLFRVVNLTIMNVKGYGCQLEPGAGLSARGNHGHFDNLRIEGCVWGWKDSPGSGAEYCTVNNIHVTGCAEAGIESAAGNILWSGGHCLDNLKDGFRLFGGANNAHGIVTGMNINHNPQYNLYADGVTNGMTFAGCHFYANGSTGAGASYLKNCKGIVLDGGNFDGWLYNDSGVSSGQNYFLNMYCPGDYGDVKLLSTNAATKQLTALGNYGAGAYTAGVTINTSSAVSVAVERAVSATQSLTTGVATELDFPVTVSDRRETFSAMSIFTAPEAGTYKIGGVQYFSGTTLDPAASKIELHKNGVVYAEYFPSALRGTGLLCFNHEIGNISLAANDTLNLVATITGTGTILHGSSTVRCSLFVERTA